MKPCGLVDRVMPLKLEGRGFNPPCQQRSFFLSNHLLTFFVGLVGVFYQMCSIVKTHQQGKPRMLKDDLTKPALVATGLELAIFWLTGERPYH